MQSKILSKFLYLNIVLGLSLIFNLNAMGGTKVYCYGVKNGPEPLSSNTVKGAWAIANPAITTQQTSITYETKTASIKLPYWKPPFFTTYSYSYQSPVYKTVSSSYFNSFQLDGNSSANLNGKWGNPSPNTGTIGSGGWMNYYRLGQSVSYAQIVQACKFTFLNPNAKNSLGISSNSSYQKSPFSPNDINGGLINILPVASTGFFQYPIIENTKILSYINNYKNNISDTSQSININSNQSFLNYGYVNILKDIAFSTYGTTPYSIGDNEPIKNKIGLPGDFVPLKILVPSKNTSTLPDRFKGNAEEKRYNNSTYGIAAKSNSLQQIVIAFKGTGNESDGLTADVQLFTGINEGENSDIENYIYQAYLFYKDIKNNPNNYGFKIILSGHSLGGYIASQIGVRTGEIVRVFSSPSNFLTAKKINLASAFAFVGYLPLPNVINFYRQHDAVATLSQAWWRNPPVNSSVIFPNIPTFNVTNPQTIVHNHLNPVDANTNLINALNLYPDAVIMNNTSDVLTTNINYVGCFPDPKKTICN